MAKGRSTTQRKPIKAKGSLPAPKVAPKRNFVPLQRRRPIQIAAAAIVVALIALVVWRVIDARGDSRRERRAITRFENSVQVLFTGLTPTIEQMSSEPAQFEIGTLPPEAFQGKPDQWIEKLRTVNVSLRERDVPSELSTARALCVQSILLFIDAAKSFRLAAQIPDGDTRVSAVKNGEALMAHGQAEFTLFQREMNRVKVQLGIISESEAGLDQPVQLAPEEPVPPLPGGENQTQVPQPSP